MVLEKILENPLDYKEMKPVDPKEISPEYSFEGLKLLSSSSSRLVITFLPRSKRLLISRLQSPSAVILEPPKIKSSTVSPSIPREVMGPDAMIFVF